tara:strand:+ start:223 stop:810 length:588 start_codon:yes stop_codon:yes gene_type:complete
MRKISSSGINRIFILIYGSFIFTVAQREEVEIVFLILLCLPLLFSINIVYVDSYGISKHFYIFNIRYKFYSWDDIKYFIEVKEEYWAKNKDGRVVINTIWFVDKKDKLRMRLKKSRKNIEKLQVVINRFKDKCDNLMYVSHPFLKRLRISKVIPITDESQLTDSQQKTLLILKKRKYAGENIDEIAEEMNLKRFL